MPDPFLYPSRGGLAARGRSPAFLEISVGEDPPSEEERRGAHADRDDRAERREQIRNEFENRTHDFLLDCYLRAMLGHRTLLRIHEGLQYWGFNILEHPQERARSAKHLSNRTFPRLETAISFVE